MQNNDEQKKEAIHDLPLNQSLNTSTINNTKDGIDKSSNAPTIHSNVPVQNKADDKAHDDTTIKNTSSSGIDKNAIVTTNNTQITTNTDTTIIKDSIKETTTIKDNIKETTTIKDSTIIKEVTKTAKKETDSEGDAAEEEVEQSPDKRWSKRSQKVTQRDIPGINEAYLAMDTETGNEVVWNEFHFTENKNFRHKESIIRQVFDNLVQLRHTNLVRFHKYWTDKSKQKPRIIFITESMSSGCMSRFLQRTRAISNSLSLKSWKKWCIQILSALNYLHSCIPGVVHSNLTINTIFIQQNGLIKIGCVAPHAIRRQVKALQEAPKNLHYLAPELKNKLVNGSLSDLDRNYEVTVESDIYAFGICALEIAIPGGLASLGNNSNASSTADPTNCIVNQEMIQKALDSLEDSCQRMFIQSCLKEDPKERATAKKLLFHPVLFQIHSLKLLAAHKVVRIKLTDNIAEEHFRVADTDRIAAVSQFRDMTYAEVSSFQPDLDKLLDDVKNGIYPIDLMPEHPTTLKKIDYTQYCDGYSSDDEEEDDQKETEEVSKVVDEVKRCEVTEQSMAETQFVDGIESTVDRPLSPDDQTSPLSTTKTTLSTESTTKPAKFNIERFSTEPSPPPKNVGHQEVDGNDTDSQVSDTPTPLLEQTVKTTTLTSLLVRTDKESSRVEEVSDKIVATLENSAKSEGPLKSKFTVTKAPDNIPPATIQTIEVVVSEKLTVTKGPEQTSPPIMKADTVGVNEKVSVPTDGDNIPAATAKSETVAVNDKFTVSKAAESIPPPTVKSETVGVDESKKTYVQIVTSNIASHLPSNQGDLSIPNPEPLSSSLPAQSEANEPTKSNETTGIPKLNFLPEKTYVVESKTAGPSDQKRKFFVTTVHHENESNQLAQNVNLHNDASNNMSLSTNLANFTNQPTNTLDSLIYTTPTLNAGDGSTVLDSLSSRSSSPSTLDDVRDMKMITVTVDVNSIYILINFSDNMTRNLNTAIFAGDTAESLLCSLIEESFISEAQAPHLEMLFTMILKDHDVDTAIAGVKKTVSWANTLPDGQPILNLTNRIDGQNVMVQKPVPVYNGVAVMSTLDSRPMHNQHLPLTTHLLPNPFPNQTPHSNIQASQSHSNISTILHQHQPTIQHAQSNLQLANVHKPSLQQHNKHIHPTNTQPTPISNTTTTTNHNLSNATQADIQPNVP
uniref:Protein kinase domain-containing protein n=1 Tax=Rhabditophanes sp. KR3021 TaxID=114890 RepID=A0AC35U896_9BILA